MREILFGVIAGLALGLPQGMRDISALSTTGLPIESIYTIGIFGSIGGFILGYLFSVQTDDKKPIINGYFFFLVGTLSIGVPTVARYYDGDIFDNLTMPGLFFTSIGLSMILGGGIRYVFGNRT